MTLRELLRKPFVDTPRATPVNLTGKYAIVTGASPGSLGYETARTLARWGANVTVTTRKNTADTVQQLKTALAKEGASAGIDGHDMDLSVAPSVTAFSQWYLQNHGDRLDILVNNAGIHLDLMSDWQEPRLTNDGVEIHWRTNYLGTVQLTHELLPLLLKTGDDNGEARVVNVVSQLHSRGSNAGLFDASAPYNSWRAYGLSKLALIHFTYELDRRYAREKHLKSYCLHPAGKSGASTNVAGKGLEGHALINLLRRLAAPIESLFMASAEEGAQTQIYCATAPEAPSGHYFQNCAVAPASDDTQDHASGKRLWDETARWLEQLGSA